MSAGIFGIGTGTDLMASAATVAQSLSTRSTEATSSTAAAGSSTQATSSSGASGDISSNDFLTLLVTEMKNQDPTQPTDPNAYIQQLTEVNSLQQLIAINQDLTNTAGTGTGASPVSGTTGA